MSIIVGNSMRIWREEDRQSLHQNHQIFRDTLVAQSRAFVEAGNDGMAASYAEMAAVWAVAKHPGLFASPELEQIVTMLGRRLPSGPDKRRPPSSGRRHILHLTTSVGVVGGHNKMIWRWVRSDITNRHSLVLTRQPRRPDVPAYLKQAVDNADGKIYRINDKVGGLMSWARELRKLAWSFDLVVVHSYPPTLLWPSR